MVKQIDKIQEIVINFIEINSMKLFYNHNELQLSDSLQSPLLCLPKRSKILILLSFHYFLAYLIIEIFDSCCNLFRKLFIRIRFYFDSNLSKTTYHFKELNIKITIFFNYLQ